MYSNRNYSTYGVVERVSLRYSYFRKYKYNLSDGLILLGRDELPYPHIQGDLLGGIPSYIITTRFYVRVRTLIHDGTAGCSTRKLATMRSDCIRDLT